MSSLLLLLQLQAGQENPVVLQAGEAIVWPLALH
jgi:hypothetical protein